MFGKAMTPFSAGAISVQMDATERHPLASKARAADVVLPRAIFFMFG